MKCRFLPFALLALTVPVAQALTISMPMKFVNVAPPFYVDQYYKMNFEGPVASIVNLPLTASALLFSDNELPLLENQRIKRVLLRPKSIYGSFDLTRFQMHASRRNNLHVKDRLGRSWPFVVSEDLYLEYPRDPLIAFLNSMEDAGQEEIDFLVQTFSGNEYAVQFKNISRLRGYLGLQPQRSKAMHEPPILCVNALTTPVPEPRLQTPPYLRLVK